MNAFIRNQKNILKYGISNYNSGHPRKYAATPHYRSFITRKHRQEKCQTTTNINSRDNSCTTLQQLQYRSRLDCNQTNPYPVISSASFESWYRNSPLSSSAYLHGAGTTYNDQRRAFHLSSKLLEQSSSKIETTVKAIKTKQKEKEEELKKEFTQNIGAIASNASEPVKSPAVLKKPLKTRIWEEIVHYYHGFRLLFVDMKISLNLVWRVLNGKKLSRRENRLLVRTTSDLFRLIPFSIFIIVPFMELLLPVFIKFFPGMLPSTFQTAKEREDKLKQSLQVKLEMAKFLQKTLDEMSVQQSKDNQGEEAKQFSEFYRKIKDPNGFVTSDDIIKFSKRFEDEITLDSLSREQLIALCRVLELGSVGTTNFLRFLLRMKLRSLAADDRVISREGVDALDLFELQQACKTRGMRAYGLPAERLRAQLAEWIELSLSEKVPPTLLLLTRALRISDSTTTTDKLKEIIRVLPDTLGAQTKVAISEIEGKIDNKAKIEAIKEEERKIKEEREEERAQEKEKAAILVDKAPTIESTTPEFVATPTPSPRFSVVQQSATSEAQEKSISTEDVELLGAALESVSKGKQQLLVEKETIKDLKEEIEDYKEDVEELREITTSVKEAKEKVHESRAAKILFKKVNAMIGQLDTVLTDLEKKGKQIQETKHGKAAAPTTAKVDGQIGAEEEVPEELVRVDELINAIKQVQKTSDESRLRTIESVLSKIDTDQDGHIKVDDVLKVIKTIGTDNVKLNEKQIEELIEMLDKEEIIEAEEKIEKALAKSAKETKKAEAEAELKDTAPVLQDKAKDLNETDGKNVFLSELKDTKIENILPKTPADISKAVPSSIPPPPTTSNKVNPKDKML